MSGVLRRLARWAGRTSRTLRVAPMNLELLHHVHPWRPGDVVPAAAFTAEQREWLTRSGAVRPTALEATVPDAPPAPAAADLLTADAAAAEVLALRAALGAAPAEIARLKAELASAKADAVEYEAMIAESERKAKGLEGQLAAARTEILALRAGGQPAV